MPDFPLLSETTNQHTFKAFTTKQNDWSPKVEVTTNRSLLEGEEYGTLRLAEG